MHRNVKESFDIGKDAYLQRVYCVELNIHSVDLNYLDGMVIFNMMGTEDESEAEHFYNQIKNAYESLTY